MKNLLLSILAITCTSGVFAQEKYEQGRPNDPNYAYLSEYSALKNYIDYEKYPNFKLGIGTTASEYSQKGIAYRMINANFTETVPGNAMKMASCVNNNGAMNFSTVKTYINNATAAGLNVYGHTLAWHAQQPVGWLLSLMQDHPAKPIEGADTPIYQEMVSKDFRTSQNIGWHSDFSQYGFSVSYSNTDGLIVHCTKVCSQNYEVQYVAMDNIPAEKGKKYKMIMTVKGSKAGSMTAKLGDWSSGPAPTLQFTDQWQDIEVEYNCTVNNPFLLLQHGKFVGDVYIKQITFMETVMGKTVNEQRRCVVVEAAPKVASDDETQLLLKVGEFSQGAQYTFSALVRADKSAKATTNIKGTTSTAMGDISFTPTWKTVTASGTFSKGGTLISLNLGALDEENRYFFDDMSLLINNEERLVNGDFEGTDVSSFNVKIGTARAKAVTISDEITYLLVPTATPQTPEEKHDTLVWAMDKWISGMMQACNGKVKAWDVVNEAISGGGNDGQGNYTLQHYAGYNPGGTWDVGGDAFYWQDFMGDLEYVRQAVRLARKYGPEDIKLFINDYNLESDWDDNKKLKSLINWIKKWEADGVTYVDGIGTQMHISYYKNANTQNSKKSHITKMFELMAASGKLVRVSELDMGYVDINGNDVATNNMTEEQHHEMADFYEWIIKEFFRIVPASQQWGICQWCATDSPANSGWRANTPVGIWDLDYYRKHVYAGFVKGLTSTPSAIEDVHVDAPILQNVYSLDGVCIKRGTTTLDGLKPGLYIVGGKKVVVN